MSIFDRIGFDAGAIRLEASLDFAEANGFYYLDFNADTGPNHMDTWSAERITAIRDRCETTGINIGLHTLSGVNVAELSPYVSRGVENYMRASIDLANRLGCRWTILHAGYHFTSDLNARLDAAIARLSRISTYAADTGQRVLLENLNYEPEHAEVNYLAHNIEECTMIFDVIPASRLGWAFTVNHAHLVSEGIDGFLDAFGIERIGEVRLADNNGDYEEHMIPGNGNIDFKSCLNRLENSGYRGHYSMAYGSLDEKIASRQYLASLVD
jgi:sugar phosphate isomerase/epimerase